MNEIVISGFGIASSLGTGISENWALASKSHTGIKEHTFEQGHVAYLAKANQFKDEDNLFQMSRAAMEEAIETAGLHPDDLKQTGLVFSHGSPDGTFIIKESERLQTTGRVRPDTVFSTMNSYVGAKLAKEFNLNEVVISNSAACCGSAQSIHIAMSLIKSGLLDRCICGGAEVIDYFIQKSFESMRIVLSNCEKGSESMRPFGSDRNGLILGEGAGFVLIESEKSCEKRNKTPIANIVHSEYQNLPDSVYGDVKDVSNWVSLIENNINVSEIDCILAHGTSTKKGDKVEAEAINKILHNTPVTSLKYLFGHTLSASCILDIVLGLSMLKEQKVLGSGQHYETDEALRPLNLQNKTAQLKINSILKLTAGFGGGISAIQLSLP